MGTTYHNASLIYNPCAGKLRGRRAGLLARVLEALQAGGHRVTAYPTPCAGGAGALARERIAAGADLILTLGGDGTINETLQGVVGCGVPLAAIPAGTANVLTRELGLGCNPLDVAGRLSEWVPRRIAAGVLHCEPDARTRYFLLMAGVGFDAHIVYRLSLGLKSRLGQLAYWSGAFNELGRRLEPVEVSAAGESLTCAFALASRVRNYAGYLEIANRASLLRDDFEIVLFGARSALRLYWKYLLPVVLRRATRTKGVFSLRAAGAGFHGPSDARVYVQVDGEYAGRLPARVEVAPQALTLLLPPAFLRTS